MVGQVAVDPILMPADLAAHPTGLPSARIAVDI
jgi:hypothetical protein